jgi:ParB-like nuclease domain
MTRLTLPLTSIADDVELRPRVEIDAETWQHYADLLAEGVELPPVLAVRDGDVFWLVDGYRRVRAYRELRFESIEADVIDGTQRDALRLSLVAMLRMASRARRRTLNWVCKAMPNRLPRSAAGVVA